MFSTSFGDIDIALVVGLLADAYLSNPGPSVYTAIFSRVPASEISCHSAKQRGDNVARRAKNSAQDSNCRDAKRKEANYTVVLTDRMPEPPVLANC